MALSRSVSVRPRKKLYHIHIKHEDAEKAIRSALAQRLEKVTMTLHRFLNDSGILAGLLTLRFAFKMANAFGTEGSHQNMMSYTYQLCS